ncbi:MAG: hypothetical protein WAQ98_11285 [Blastocatellia bacterium]
MSRQSLLIANLKELTGRKDLLDKELEVALNKTKELKIKIKANEKEITKIIDELSGKISYPILDEIEKEEIKNPVIQNVVLENGIELKRDGEDCLFIRDGKIYSLPLENIDYHFFGVERDCKNNEEYLKLCDDTWEFFQKVPAQRVEDLFNYLADDEEKSTKTEENPVLKKEIAEAKELAQEPERFRISSLKSFNDGLALTNLRTLETSDCKILNSLDSVELLNYFNVQSPDLLKDEELQWAWDNYDKGFPWHEEIFSKADPKLYELIRLSRANLILHDHGQRAFGVLSAQKILAKYNVKRLGVLDQNQLKEIWDDLENGEENAVFNKPDKLTKTSKTKPAKKSATVGI